MRRKQRLIGSGEVSFYHVIFKVPDRTPGNSEYAFGEDEKAKMEELVLDMEATYLIRVVGYCHMSTHSHLICMVERDAAKNMSGEELSERFCRHFKRKPQRLNCRTKALRRFRHNINDVSMYGKVLQQRFARWYNEKYGHRGNVWTPRFKSVLLTSAQALLRCLQYVELNPVRAHMVQHPCEYRHNSWSQIQAANGRGLEMKRRIIIAVRFALGWLHEKWSDKRIYSHYRMELQLIDEHGPMGRKVMEKLGNCGRSLLLQGHGWWSGSDGVVSIGGDKWTLVLETGRTTRRLPQSWEVPAA